MIPSIWIGSHRHESDAATIAIQYLWDYDSRRGEGRENLSSHVTFAFLIVHAKISQTECWHFCWFMLFSLRCKYHFSFSTQHCYETARFLSQSVNACDGATWAKLLDLYFNHAPKTSSYIIAPTSVCAHFLRMRITCFVGPMKTPSIGDAFISITYLIYHLVLGSRRWRNIHTVANHSWQLEGDSNFHLHLDEHVETT